MASSLARRVGGWATVTLGALVTGACSGDLSWDNGRAEVLWVERQVVFALSPLRGRIDAYSIRNGVSWLGGVVLPAGECFHAQELDPATGRLWLWSDRGGVLIDGYRVAAVTRWKGDGSVAPLPPSGRTLTARAQSVVCANGRVVLARAPGQASLR